MKKYGIYLLVCLLLVSIALNFYFPIKNSIDGKKTTDRYLTYFYRQVKTTDESLQMLIDSPSWTQVKIVDGHLQVLSVLCRSNNEIIYDAGSDFEYMSATFRGPCLLQIGRTQGIWDDEVLSESEKEYCRQIKLLLHMLMETMGGTPNDKSKLRSVNGVLEEIHKRIEDSATSPFLLIKQT